MILSAVVVVAAALWVGGQLFFAAVVTPAVFRSLQKEEASKFLGALFPIADRWFSLWGLITFVSLLLFFWGRHGEIPSLMLEIPAGLAFLLTCHSVFIIHPQIRELKRKMSLPDFRGSVHLQVMEFSFGRLHHYSVTLHLLVLGLGLATLVLIPSSLK